MRPLDDSSSRGRQNIADPPPIPSKPRSRSQGAGSRRVAPASGSAAEKSLPNGDLYTGAFAGKTPHGAGKYLWADGCVYEGEWRRGEPSGKGKFTWPSGAVFNGEFRAGRMDGSGVLIGGDGESYEGGWKADKKHGYGTKRYANGDTYEGHWRRDLQHGDGRYTWRNGDRYLGEWRDGAISGRGALTWADGNNYNGRWENGVPKGGGGVFTLFPGEEIAKTFPRICIWESDGDDITCDIVDTLEVYRDGAEFEEKQAPQSRCFAGGEVKKQGEMISKGHKNYDLMLNLQLGIRYSVGRPASTRMRELKPGDFDPREKFWTRFPPEGSKFTPPHQSVEFRWKDYCPMVFRYLRKLFLVDPADYMLAICGDDALRELSSPGKSGSFFYLTQDDRFMIKTVKKSEVKVLIRMLSSYYQHVCKYENSLVTKFFGVHCVKPIGGQKVRFIIMGNLFCSEYRIHRRFDLKGSSHGRTTDKAEGEIDETTTLKDLDLNFVFRLQNSWFNQLIGQIDLDCEFLEAERIMDYSLLVGLHFRDDLSASKIGLLNSDASSGISTDSYTPSNLSNRYNNAGLEISEKNGSSQSVSELQGQNMELMLDSRRPLVRLGANMPARAEPLSRESESIFEVVLYFGIIDILQDYDISKRLEHAYKSLQADPTSISAVDPKLYSRRFRDFIYKVFLEDE